MKGKKRSKNKTDNNIEKTGLSDKNCTSFQANQTAGSGTF